MTGQTGFTLKGVNLRTQGWDIASVEGWDAWPGQRMGEADYGYNHGSRFDDRGFFMGRDFGVSLHVLPYDPTTGVQTDPAENAQANLDDVLGLFYSLSGLTLVRTMPDATVRELLDCRAVAAWSVEKGVGTFGRRINAVLRAGYPFWQQTGVVSSGAQSGAFSLTNNGNAPINNMVVVMTTAGRLTHDDSGDYVETDQNAITIDVGARTAKNGSTFKDNHLARNRAWWLQMEPGVNDFTVSGGGNATVTFRHHWL